MSETNDNSVQIAVDRLFEGFQLCDSNANDVIRSVVELTFFENRILGLKGTLPKALSRVRQVLLLGQDQELPKQIEKQTKDELSRLGQRTGKAREVPFLYLVPCEKTKDSLASREKRRMSLPLAAFGNETKKRIFYLFSKVIREEIQHFHQMRLNLTYPDRIIIPLNEMLQELTRHFSIRESVDDAEKLIFLRASFNDAKANYDDLKAQLEYAAESENTARLENRLKKAQNQVSTLASEIQRVEQLSVKTNK